MNTYVVYSHQYGGKDGGEPRRVDRIEADSVSFWQNDPELAVIFDDEEGNTIGVVRDFDAIYLESAVQLGDPDGTTE